MYRGHDPERIREYSFRDIMLYLEVEPTLDIRQSIAQFEE